MIEVGGGGEEAMTQQEFVNQYGTVIIHFFSYYKYSFTYRSLQGLQLETTMAAQALSNTYRNTLRPIMTVE